jgi:hypothetical protein
MTMYNIQNDWISGFCPLPGILSTRKHNVRKLDLFPSSNDGRETPTLLGPSPEDRNR